MSHYLKVIVGINLVVLLVQVAVVAAQQAKLAPAAPIPHQILAAKKVFIANAGGDERGYEDPIFDGGPARAYDEFYAAMKTFGRYDIVGTPADADLIFEIGLRVPMAAGIVARGDALTAKPFDPQLRLEIRDAKTNALLWAFTEHVPWAILRAKRDRNFDQSMAKIVSDLRGLNAPPDTVNKP